jgi:hypothetical protein
MNFTKTIIAAGLVAVASSSNAVTNGSFAQGLTGWTTLGDVASVGGVALITNSTFTDQDDFPSAAGAFNVSQASAADAGSLETFVGLGQLALDTSTDFATEGSALKQSFLVNAGDVLTFNYRLRTNETGVLAQQDYGFAVIDGGVLILDTASAAMSPDTPYAFATPVNTFSFTYGSARMSTLAFGVVDMNDFITTSQLEISNVVLTPIPEPITLALWAAGLGIVGGFKARRR